MTNTRAQRRLQQRLSALQEQLRRTRANERVLVEQVAFLASVADDADIRRLVAATPIADREWQTATRNHDNHARLLDEARTELTRLDRERDDLLDQLLELETT